MDGNYYWEPDSIISGNVSGGEMKCGGLSLDVSHWALMGSLVCGKGGSFFVNGIIGLLEAVLTKSFIQHQVMKYIINYFSASAQFVQLWECPPSKGVVGNSVF